METPPSLPPLPIMVVEDDPVDLYLLHRVLTAHELAHELHVIGTSADVLDAVHRLAQQEGRLTTSQMAELLDMSVYDVQRKAQERGLELGATAEQYHHALETVRQLRPQRDVAATS